jgi:Uma2 family endonuclease
MMIEQKTWTVEEFDRYIALPENVSRNFEFIAGGIVEKMVSSPRSSTIGGFMVTTLTIHVRERDLGRVTGPDGGYVVGGAKLIPDVAFVSKIRQPVQPSDAYNPLPPDLVVEVISPTDRASDIREKREIYRKAGILLWEIYPNLSSIDVYAPGHPVQTLSVGEILDGGDVLPAFHVAVSEIFA